MKNNELTIKNGKYLADLNFGSGLTSELSGLDSGFDRIKLAAGGALTFEIPNLESSEEPTFVREFSAVILYHHPLFTYYENRYNGNNNPPDCCSFDGVVGAGNPGGKCRFCKLNMFGSGENGSKACKNKHRLYLLRENEILPDVLILPASSIQELSKYIRRLLSIGKKSNSVVTKFSLKRAVNKTGISFSKINFSLDRILSDEEIRNLETFSEQIKNHMQNFDEPAEGVVNS